MMCLAEALLRIPDATTADALIEDTFATGNWKQHLGQSDSTLVNASTWALMLTGSVLDLDSGESVSSWFGGLIKRTGEPGHPSNSTAPRHETPRHPIRHGRGRGGLDQEHARGEEKKATACRTTSSAKARAPTRRRRATCNPYLAGIRQIAASTEKTDLFERPGISVKLSALHVLLQHRAGRPRVRGTAAAPKIHPARGDGAHHRRLARCRREANRLELQLRNLQKPDRRKKPRVQKLSHGIGFVLQAYQKRAIHVATSLRTLAKQNSRRLPVRLVKGAYWDSEVKYAQAMGLPGYPVFTRKEHTRIFPTSPAPASC